LPRYFLEIPPHGEKPSKGNQEEDWRQKIRQGKENCDKYSCLRSLLARNPPIDTNFSGIIGWQGRDRAGGCPLGPRHLAGWWFFATMAHANLWSAALPAKRVTFSNFGAALVTRMAHVLQGTGVLSSRPDGRALFTRIIHMYKRAMMKDAKMISVPEGQRPL